MYAFIRGEVVENNENGLVIDCGGIGYDLQATADCVMKCKVGEQVKIPTYLAISQDEVRLFGFGSKAEKSMFLHLIEISGIGPKVAIGILSSISVSDLALAIVTGDIKRLSKVKGLGKKTAERIVLELKDKISESQSSEVSGAMSQVAQVSSTKSVNEDAVLALMTFGYTRAESEAAVAKVQQDGMSVEQIIFKAMQIA